MTDPEEAHRDLLRLIVHDMRSSLQVVQGYLGLIARDPELSDKTRGWLGKVSGGARGLVALSDTVADIARLDGGEDPFHPEPCPVRAAAEAALERVRAEAPRHEFSLESAREGLAARVDPGAFALMLTHLLQHAARFSPAGSVVTLTVAEAGERVRMTVGDDGPSVDPAEREALFDLLAQARLRRERKRYANGLGLVYCRMAAEAQGGSVRLADGDRYAVVVELPVGG